MKEPFVGQSVWYRATKKDVQAESEFTGYVPVPQDLPRAAIITLVISHQCVNLVFFSSNGVPVARGCVLFVQRPTAAALPRSGQYCEPIPERGSDSTPPPSTPALPIICDAQDAFEYLCRAIVRVGDRGFMRALGHVVDQLNLCRGEKLERESERLRAALIEIAEAKYASPERLREMANIASGETPEARAEEFLQEVATVARKYPDRFEKMIVMHEETLPSGRTVVRYATRGASLNELLGLIEIGKRRIIERAESDESA